jgi:hypothetical protein
VIENGAKDFDYGTIMIPMGVQDDQDKVHEIIQTITEEDGITVYDLPSGLTPSGMDLGSGNFENLEAPKVAMIGGSGSNSSEVGEAWHLFDQRYHMPLSIIKSDNVGRTDLSRYNVIISSGYGVSESAGENLKEWVRDGGTLIVFKNAIRWAKSLGLANVEYVENEDSDEGEEVKVRPYVKAGEDRGAGFIGGSIFNAKLDLTHPLGYGFNDEDITVFRNSTLFIEKGENPYSTPLYYTDDPLASGYSNDENLERIKGSGAIVVSSYGGGNVIAMTDNPNFRAFWYGTNKLFANAIFFGETISGGTAN